jgi:hypothetical protein
MVCNAIGDGLGNELEFGTCLLVDGQHHHACMFLHQLASLSTRKPKSMAFVYGAKPTGELVRMTFRAAMQNVCETCESMKGANAHESLSALVEGPVKQELLDIMDADAKHKVRNAPSPNNNSNRQNNRKTPRARTHAATLKTKSRTQAWFATGLAVAGLKQEAAKGFVNLHGAKKKSDIIKALSQYPKVTSPPPATQRDPDTSDSDTGSDSGKGRKCSSNKRRRDRGSRGGGKSEKTKIARLERELQEIKDKLKAATSSGTESDADPSLAQVLERLSNQLATPPGPGGQTVTPQPQNYTITPGAGPSNQVAHPQQLSQPMMQPCYYAPPPVGYQQPYFPYGGFFPTVTGNRVTAPTPAAAPQALNLNLYVNSKPAPEGNGSRLLSQRP